MRVLCCLLVLAVAALLVPDTGAEEEKQEASAAGLPMSWAGCWRGPGKVVVPGRPDLDFTMELSIKPLADGKGYAWMIVFREHSGGRANYDDQLHAYVLRPVDAEQGHWQMDQRNSIKIDCFLVGDALYARFDQSGNVIDARYEMQNGAVEFLSTSYGNSALSRTGGEDGAPTVSSFRLRAIQTARMTRVEDEE